ncbi:STAS domain-containing protein [Sinomonas sp. G460-2]|uniref:STAS domain-containing protein n=1 Tax=Sinomonas sp. G460-2 TaxID=3393464 RepID=UPI0039EFD8B0
MAAKGRLNLVAAPELKAAVNDAIAAGHRRLVLDLAEVDFMDSSGLGAIVVCLRAAREAGGDLRLANAGEQVRMVLELTGLLGVLKPYASSEGAYRNG